MVGALSLAQARRHFAEELRVVCHLTNERLIEAFATVPREHFAGPGPWRILHEGEGYWTTADVEPHWLYHNVLIALDESRGLNIGSPSLWAYHFDRMGVGLGEQVLQIGAGSGYYTALLAELVGKDGRVDALEIDAPLAALARENLKPWPWTRVHHADATRPIDGKWHVIVAFAGATAPHQWWLDAIADGGRLLLPMTGARKACRGFMLRIVRTEAGLAAQSVGWVGFYPCQGGRSAEGEAALDHALGDPVGQQALRSLRRDAHEHDETCWLHGEGWCLSKCELD
jgi:protein-L-isoaspartate(D-aspartate) O-methyltransferase